MRRASTKIRNPTLEIHWCTRCIHTRTHSHTALIATESDIQSCRNPFGYFVWIHSRMTGAQRSYHLFSSLPHLFFWPLCTFLCFQYFEIKHIRIHGSLLYCQWPPLHFAIFHDRFLSTLRLLAFIFLAAKLLFFRLFLLFIFLTMSKLCIALDFAKIVH